MTENNVTPEDIDRTNAEAIHEYRMATDPKYVQGIQVAEAKARLEAEDRPLQDMSTQMVLGTAGLGKIATYSNAPLHMASRVVNAIGAKDPFKLVAIPRMQELKRALSVAGPERERNLWRATMNGVKANSLFGGQ